MTRTAVFAALLVAACAGSAPIRTQYLLRGDSRGSITPAEAPARVGLGRIAVAPYLDQAGIVVEIEAGQVRAARRHQWAEPLDEGLRSYLRAEISSRLGYDVSARGGDSLSWDYTVDVYVDRLHGTLGGTALLDASFRIQPRAGEVVELRFSGSAPLPRDGYAGLVEAESSLLRRLAEEIAVSLQELAR